MIVVITANAEDDLSALRHWIAQDDPDRADTFLDEIEQRIAALDQWAERFPVAFESREGAIRRLVHRRYRVLYRVRGDLVEVLHVHHGSRNALPGT